MTTRRDFLRTAAGAALGSAAVSIPARLRGAPAVHTSLRATPVAISSANGMAAVERALEVLAEGGSTVEAAVRGVNLVERDPDDRSVGYGGLPNFEGVVQLDSSVMHGPTRGAGAVGALEGIRTPSLVALDVMRYTDHVMLVGEGAQRFARSMGHRVEDLLTEESRRTWLRWRARLGDDDYLAPGESGEPVEGFPPAPRDGMDDEADGADGGADAGAPTALGPAGLLDSHDGLRPHGTINCNVVDADGSVSGVTTTSGLAFKVPGRVGDSPIVGAGLYVDDDVGAAGSTGRGEAVIKTVGSHTVVEGMRRGSSPTDACLEALRRVVRWTVEPRLLRDDGRPAFNVNYYAVNAHGEFGAAALWEGSRFAVNADGDVGRRDSAFLFERDAR